MPELTTAEERKYVEAAWKYNFLCLRSGSGNLPWHSWIGVVNKPDNWDGYFATEAEAIHAAYLYTLEREEQIRQIEEEISICGLIILLRAERGDLTAPIYKRTVARLRHELEQLKKGMRG